MVKVIQCGMADPWPISDTPATLPVITTITQHFDSNARILKLWQYVRSVDFVCGWKTPHHILIFISRHISCYFKLNLAIFRARKIFYTRTLCFVQKTAKHTFSGKFKARNFQNWQLISFQTSFCRDCSTTCFHHKSKCNSKNLEIDFHFCSKSPIYRDSSISCFPGIK